MAVAAMSFNDVRFVVFGTTPPQLRQRQCEAAKQLLSLK